MKKIMIVSGILAAVLFVSLLAGANNDETAQKALRRGNREYEKSSYGNALETYGAGLSASPENGVLNFNAAQAAYSLGQYEKAVGYYGKAEDCPEKYLNAGNIFFKAGEATEDEEQKMQLYLQALQLYHEGIIKFPQDLPLKYNYDLLLEKIELIPEDSEQEDAEGEQGDGESGDDEQQEAYEGEDGDDEPDLDQEAIERILQMLENQEEESLKNNREVVGGGDGKNEW